MFSKQGYRQGIASGNAFEVSCQDNSNLLKVYLYY